MHELPKVRSQGNPKHLNIPNYAHFVPCTFSFSPVSAQVQVVPFLEYEKRWWGLYVLLVDFVPTAFVFYCICNICSFFLTVEPPLRKRHFLSKPDQDLVCRRFKNRVKFVSANSFVCGSYLSLGSFLNRFPLYIIKREKIAFPYFTTFLREFL